MSGLSGLAGAWLRRRSPARRGAAWVLAIVAPVVGTLALTRWRSSLAFGAFLICMLLVVVVVAALGGVWPAFTAVTTSAAGGAFSYERLALRDPGGGFVSLIGFVVVGVVVGLLIGELMQLADAQASSARVEAALRRVATLVARGPPADELFAAVSEEVGRLLQATQTTMVRYDSDGMVTAVGGWVATGDLLTVGSRREVGGKNLTTIVAQTGRPARIDSYADTSGAVAAYAREVGFRSAVGAPIIVQGRLWGVMLAASTDEHRLVADAETRLASFTELIATAIANAESLAALTASRARVVAAADETRRQIERDLHDGAQQRLVSLGLQLRAAQMAVPPQADALAGELARVADGLDGVLEDLQEMARGIHPAILARGGLGPALRTLARRCSVPVELNVQAGARLPEPVEVAAYYVVAEALTNAAKHARASVVVVDADAAGHSLRMCVRDDGTGGADPARGTGLIGLKDRVEALGGTISVQSPAGAGTSLTVELPLPG